jgi:tRNA (guanosine-2'-O-)-methyltransferase
MTTSDQKWFGASDKSERKPLDYFIPEPLQNQLGSLRHFIAPFVTEQRILRMEKVLQLRSRTLLPIFENTHHTHNISAVLRTMDALGYQDLVQLYSDPAMRFRPKDTVERGSSHWLSPRRGDNLETCVQMLKKSNYALGLVTLPTFFKTSGQYSADLPSFSSHDFSKDLFKATVGNRPIALVFGNEAAGIEEAWKDHADFYVHVDMFGFVESLNMSVCAAILMASLREATANLPKFLMPPWEQTLLLDHWLAKDTQNAAELVKTKRADLWCYFDFVRRGLFFDPFENASVRATKNKL